MKSFQPKDGSGSPPSGRNGERDFRKTKRSNATHASTTDKDARLFRKAEGQESRLADLGPTLMENRNGLIVAADATLATGTAERRRRPFSQRLPEGATLGADKNYDVEAFVEGLKARGIEPHVAINGTVSKNGVVRKTAVPSEVASSLGYAISQRLRKRIEEGFGWGKTVAGLAQVKVRPRQGPRRLRLRHRRLRYRPSAKAPRPDGRDGSGGMKRGDQCPQPKLSAAHPSHE